MIMIDNTDYKGDNNNENVDDIKMIVLKMRIIAIK